MLLCWRTSLVRPATVGSYKITLPDLNYEHLMILRVQINGSQNAFGCDYFSLAYMYVLFKLESLFSPMMLRDSVIN